MLLRMLVLTNPMAAASPARLARAQGLLILFSVAIIAVFLGWLLARWMRLRLARTVAATTTESTITDAWTEAARRLNGDADTLDPEPPPDQPPPSAPDPRWRS